MFTSSAPDTAEFSPAGFLPPPFSSNCRPSGQQRFPNSWNLISDLSPSLQHMTLPPAGSFPDFFVPCLSGSSSSPTVFPAGSSFSILLHKSASEVSGSSSFSHLTLPGWFDSHWHLKLESHTKPEPPMGLQLASCLPLVYTHLCQYCLSFHMLLEPGRMASKLWGKEERSLRVAGNGKHG